jgi:hypothetical protein
MIVAYRFAHGAMVAAHASTASQRKRLIEPPRILLRD